METLLNVAFPQLMSSFNVTTSTIQWLSTTYMLTIGIIVPIVAFLLQSIKTKPLFISAMLIFIIGTTSGAISPTFLALLISRIVQGIGAGILLTMIMGVIIEIYPVAKRGGCYGHRSNGSGVRSGNWPPRCPGLFYNTLIGIGCFLWLYLSPLWLLLLVLGQLKMSPL